VTFARLAGGVAVRALDPAHRLGAAGLAEAEVVDVDGLAVRVVSTPGHTRDSLSFVVDTGGGAAVLTGDTVLGRGTTVVAHPDGRLADYLASLHRLEELAGELALTAVWPGHGPVLARPLDVVRAYLEHRARRLDQVRAAVEAGARTPRAVVEAVYAEVDRAVWPAAELSVRAQLEYLGVPLDR
jgi:glyoxylase-like metal-dependent hydrolase (beta-lactamase superfamily II)